MNPLQFLNTMFYFLDGYFQYESDEFPSLLQKPVVKLLTKRQTDSKEPKDMKKPFTATTVLENSSSNSKPISSGMKVLPDENSMTF